MSAYILTGAPGSGKTAIVRSLEASGYTVVEEAATDVIALRQALGHAEPWQAAGFIGEIIALQRQRQDHARAACADGAVFFDRSPACTLALTRFLGFPVTPLLDGEISQALADGNYEPTVFFVRNQGFVQPTAARRITYEDSLTFERLHEQVYKDLGFQLVEVPPGPLADRTALIRQAVAQQRPT
jgi:predicted ATPase